MATRTISVAGGNYNTVGAWDEGAVPTSSDDVVCRADGTSGNLTITAAAAALSINLANGSGYTGTLTINSGQTWTIAAGDITLGAGMIFNGPGTLAFTTAKTITSNGVTFGCALSIPTVSGFTITLADDMTVGGTFTQQATGNVLTINGAFTLRLNGSYTQSCPVAGSLTAIRLGGTGTWTGSGSSGRQPRVPIIIDTAGTITFSNPRIGQGTTLTYVAGTIVNGTVVVNGNCTLDVNNVAMAGVSYSVDAVSTVTLSNPLTCNEFALGSNTTMSGAHAVTCTTLRWFATATLTRVNSWTVGTLVVNSGAFTASIAGAFDQTVGTLQIFSGGAAAMQSGQILTVTAGMFLTGNGATATATLRSITASSAFTLDYQGGDANSRIFRATFTDVNMATGQTLWNYHGQTLTRTNGIRNFTRTPKPRASAYVG